MKRARKSEAHKDEAHKEKNPFFPRQKYTQTIQKCKDKRALSFKVIEVGFFWLKEKEIQYSVFQEASHQNLDENQKPTSQKPKDHVMLVFLAELSISVNEAEDAGGNGQDCDENPK